jgi:hypothetical protein
METVMSHFIVVFILQTFTPCLPTSARHGARGRGRGQPRPRGDNQFPAGARGQHVVVPNEKGAPLDRTPRKHILNNPPVPQAQNIARYA